MFNAFGIIHLFWPSDDAYFFITSIEALFYSTPITVEASPQSFEVKSYGANKCVCWEYHESTMTITANLKIDAKIGKYEISFSDESEAFFALFRLVE